MRIVGRIVQYLDLEQMPRIIDLAGLFDQPLDHVLLVIQRKLNGHARQLLEFLRSLRRICLRYFI